MIRTLTLAGLVSLGLATTAFADPCKAIPDRGPMPSYLHPGARFAGPVVYIGDGDSLCVGVGPTTDAWVEVRITDRNCAAARTAGAAPIYRGDPGYSPHLDGDGDGIACEPYRRR